jgi:hypothetical protein
MRGYDSSITTAGTGLIFFACLIARRAIAPGSVVSEDHGILRAVVLGGGDGVTLVLVGPNVVAKSILVQAIQLRREGRQRLGPVRGLLFISQPVTSGLKNCSTIP